MMTDVVVPGEHRKEVRKEGEMAIKGKISWGGTSTGDWVGNRTGWDNRAGGIFMQECKQSRCGEQA